MKSRMQTSKMRHGASSVVLIALVLVAVVMLNVIVAILAQRYEWMYKNMNVPVAYTLSDDYAEYVRETVVPEVDRVRANTGNGEKIKIIFCDSKENLEAGNTEKYVYGSIIDLCELFPEYIEIKHLNIWEQPTVAREYGVSSTLDVVCAFNGEFETISINNFFISDAASSSYVAYNGEKMLAAALMRVTQENTPVCYITANHGEQFSDYQFLFSLVQAGYKFSYIDLSVDELPEDCDMLVTFDPKQDFIAANEFSSVSEADKIEEYMSRGGKYMIFTSADTFISGARPNLEAFLEKWGVSFAHKVGDGGLEECYLIKDPQNSTTVDGYTVMSTVADNAVAEQIFGELERPNVFGNSGSINIADGFEGEKGVYISSESGFERKISPILVTYPSAEAWVGGRAVERADEEPFTLMTVTTQKCENGKTAYLVASASVEFACENAMNSAVLGNSRAVSMLYRFMGKENVPTELIFKPFASTDIESLSSADAKNITLALTITPAVIFAVLGAVVLIRRKHL
ncbi:MAG: Gldg family protein [Clostridia bacterium]|nr:Gldg family protein [Clostridia bacterium]